MSFKAILLSCAIGSFGGAYLVSGLNLITTLVGYIIAVIISWYLFGERSH